MEYKYNSVDDTDDEYEEVDGFSPLNSPIVLKDVNYDSDEDYIDEELYKNNIEDGLSDDELNDSESETKDKIKIDKNDPIMNAYFEPQLYHIPTILVIQERFNIYKKLILKDICKRYNKPFEQYAFLLKQ